jgi:serpin B
VDYLNDGPGAGQKINAWVEERTNGKIANLLSSPPPPDTSLILVNAVYFLGLWTHPFDPKLTAPGDFKLASGEKVPVPFLKQTRAYAYLAIPEGQIVKLPYGEDRAVSLLVFLPANVPGGLGALEKKLTLKNLTDYRAALKPAQVELALPKFKIVWGTNSLRDNLEKMGLTAPFSQAADFSQIAENDSLSVSDILHKAFISLDEKGTEAAAATAAIMPRSAPLAKPETFVADRPFFFLIQEETTGAILFIGRLTNPRG